MKKNLLFLAFLIAFHFLFWQEGLGINLSVFALASVSLAYSSNKTQKPRPLELLLAFSLLTSAVAVATINSAISILVLFFTTFSYIAYLTLRQSSVLESFTNGFLSFFKLKPSVLPQPIFTSKRRKPAGILYMRLAFIPVLIFIIYFILLSAGNSIFKSISDGLFGDFFQLLADISWNYVFFILLAVAVVRWVFMDERKAFLNFSAGSFLSRKAKKPTGSVRNLGLKHEHISAVMIFASLNILFAVVNFIDVKWVWFGFSVPQNFNLKEFVHEGVGWLIVTLLLSMLLIFYFFRYNLNFYPKNKTLKILGQLWIFQNAILAVSVALRTSYYMGFHGLASGRIAVLVFLIIVMFGLATLSLKILQKRNTAFVLRTTSAFALIVLTICGAVHWDKLIAEHNLRHAMANEIDVDNYLNLNPQVYPYIYENLDKVEEQITAHGSNKVKWIDYRDIDAFKSRLDFLSRNYLNRRMEVGAPSWSYGDAKAVEKLRRLVPD